ncbi:MAG: PfkB family carbohydrate kinase [Spirochaetaceae bacterium]|nr:PfkB family carbohydrate kinase [Spirochaetaceae bacterium]
MNDPINKRGSKPDGKAAVVVVGGANLDIQGISFADFVSGDSNPGIIRRSAGGVGRNIAENLARLGMDVSLVSVFGDSDEGRLLREDCRRKGIDVSQSLLVDGRTPTYLAAMDSAGALIGAVADMGAMDMLKPDQLEKRQDLFDAADYLVADTNIPAESLLWLADHYGRSGWAGGGGKRHNGGKWREREGSRAPLLFLDTVSCTKALRACGMLGACACAKPNRAECGVIAGIDTSDPVRLSAALRQKNEMPAELYLSMGEGGIYFCPEEGEPGLVTLPKASLCPKPINRSGAGDAALAAILWASAKGFPPVEKTRYALTASLLTVASGNPVSERLDEVTLLAEKARMFGA